MTRDEWARETACELSEITDALSEYPEPVQARVVAVLSTAVAKAAREVARLHALTDTVHSIEEADIIITALRDWTDET